MQRYPAAVVQSIIRAAVLGTELPDGVQKTISSGIRDRISFMFFSCCQSIADIFSHSPTNKGKLDNKNTTSAQCFSFQLESESPSEAAVDFIISASPLETYKIVSTAGYYKELQVSDDGVLKINGLLPGEYRILLQHKKDL